MPTKFERTPLDVSSFPPNLQNHVKPESPPPLKMMAARGMVPSPPEFTVRVLYQLSLDPDNSVSHEATGALEQMPPQVLLPSLQAEQPASVLDWIAELRDDNDIIEAVLLNKGTDDFTMAISGKFDVEKLKADLTGQKGVTERKVGKHTVYLDDDLEVSIISDKLIFLTGGSKSYRDASVQMLTGKSASVKKGGKMKSLLKQVKTDKHMWIVADSSRVKPQKGAPGVNETYFTFDFSSGLTLDGAMKMKSEKDATMVEDEIKKNFDQGLAFANLIGAASAFNNLKVTRKGSNLSIKTAMPDKEVSAVGVWLRNMIKSAEEEQARQRKKHERAAQHHADTVF